MFDSLLVQIANRYDDWATVQRLNPGSESNPQHIQKKMEETGRAHPEHKVRVVTESGRLIDMLI